MTTTWHDVDDYLDDLLEAGDSVLERALAAAQSEGLPPIHVSPLQGKLLHLLVRATGARSVLEVGTLAGYSTLWLGRAVGEGGSVVSLEVDPHHADVARLNVSAAGLDEIVDVRVGPALETLPTLLDVAPFDFAFIDADKESTADYVEWAVELGRPGTVIVVDNVIREGAVIDGDSADSRVQGVRRGLEAIAAHPRLDATAIQTVGAKGYDGFALALLT